MKEIKKGDEVYFYNIETGLRLFVTVIRVNKCSLKVESSENKYLFEERKDNIFFNTTNRKFYKLFKKENLKEAIEEFEDRRKATVEKRAKRDLEKALEELEVKRKEVERLERIVSDCEKVLNG